MTLWFRINPILRFTAYGIKGWMSLQNDSVHQRKAPESSIADAKRGDIGNTSSMYAKAFFEDLNLIA
jgi:orotidine-5'-phosphate decarboxylase